MEARRSRRIISKELRALRASVVYKEKMNFDLEAAERLPKNIRFGTSTWTYPGWKGIIYNNEYKSEKQFKEKCLAEYSSIPLFRTVGIDNTFYRPPTPKQLETYAALCTPGFKWISKVWERVSIAKYPRHPRYGRFKGEINDDFLNPELFNSEVLAPYREASVEKFTGPFVFQFPTFYPSVLSRESFIEKLDNFLSKISSDFQYAVEIRNKDFLVEAYFEVLNKHTATHCFNHWTDMPPLKNQMKYAALAGGLKADFFVSRLLTPLGVKYQDAVDRFQPYDKLVQPNEEMRADAARLVKRAVKRKSEAYIIVNNRSEGHAPATINSIIQQST